jgi:hypothetical protein
VSARTLIVNNKNGLFFFNSTLGIFFINIS